MQVSDIDEMIEAARVLSTPVHMETQAEIVEYYQQEYGLDWRGAIVEDMLDIATDKQGNPMSHSNVARRFQGGRVYGASRPTAKSRAEYRELGQRLPPKYYLPPAGFQIDFDGYVLISEECEPRSFSEQITGDAAYEFANAPTFRGAMNAYFKTPSDLVDEPCGPWSMDITALGEDDIIEDTFPEDSSEEEEDIEWDE